jgi:hypothetical protein
VADTQRDVRRLRRVLSDIYISPGLQALLDVPRSIAMTVAGPWSNPLILGFTREHILSLDLLSANYGESAPTRRMGIVRAADLTYDFHEGTAQGFTPGKEWILLTHFDHVSGHFNGGFGGNIPVGHDQARVSPENPSALGRPSDAAVLHADSTTSSALSFKLIISDAVSKPSSSRVAVVGGVSKSPGSA